jgi:hypothetical protein
MNWIIENKEWIFSGIGVAIILFILSILKIDKIPESKIKNVSNSSGNISKIKINVGKYIMGKKDSDSNGKNKEDIQILFIDDEKFKTVDNLKSAGWINTKTIKDVTNLDSSDVKNSDVIFVDINGVGEKLFPIDKGLGLAEALKKKYPKKYIVIYSAQEQGDRFHKALKIVDYSLSKNAEPYEFINIIENCMK